MSEKRRLKIEQIQEIFPQATTQDIEELLAIYNNDVQQVITILTQRSEEYSWKEVKKKKPQKTEPKQPKRQTKPRTDNRRYQNSSNATPKPFNEQTSNNATQKLPLSDTEADRSRQTETPNNQDLQNQQYEGYRSYGRGRGRPYPRQGGEGYGRGRGYNQAPNGAPRYPQNPRFPHYRGDRQYNQSASYEQQPSTSYDQTASNHQPDAPHQISSPAPPVQETPKISETPDDVYQNDNEAPQDSAQDQVTTSLADLNLQGSQFTDTEVSPSTNSSEKETFHSQTQPESKTTKTSPSQNLPNHPRLPQRTAPATQRWKVKESPSPTSAPQPQNTQAPEETSPPAAVPQHTHSTTESEISQDHYVQHSQQTQPVQPVQQTQPPASAPSQPHSPQPSPEPSESETSTIVSPTSSPQATHQTPPHEPSQSLQQTSSQQQNSAPAQSVPTTHTIQQPVSQSSSTTQAPHQQNAPTRSKVVILPSGMKNEEQVAFRFGNLPSMAYPDPKPSLSEDHGLSLGELSYKSTNQPHRDVHGLQDYHNPESELQEQMAQVPYPYVPYVFPYFEDGTQDARMARMGMPQPPYYDPYGVGFRQSIEPKPYPVSRSSPMSGSTYGPREKYHADSSSVPQTNQNSNALPQQNQSQTAQSQQIPQQSQQAQQPPTLLPQYYNSPQFYAYSYFPGQYAYQGMPGTHYPYLAAGRNFGYYKPTPGTYPNYGNNAYAPGTMSYEDDYKYVNMSYNPSFFAPEGLASPSISSPKTAPVGTGSPTAGQNPQHLGAAHVSKGPSAYSSPNSTGAPSNALAPEKPGSEFKNYSPNSRDTSSFYQQQLPAQILPYPQPTGYPAPTRPHHHHHLHQQTLTSQGQPPQQSQGVQGQQSGSTQIQQSSGQQAPRSQAPQTQGQ